MTITNSLETQPKCPACGETNCFDHALRTAEAQPQGVEPFPLPYCPHCQFCIGCGMLPPHHQNCTLNARTDLPRATADEVGKDLIDRAAAVIAINDLLVIVGPSGADGYETRDAHNDGVREALTAIENLARATGETTVEWQPIETAPRGIDILLVWADGHQQIEWLTDKPSFWFENEPTHWRHLPAAPVRPTRTEGEGEK